MRTIFLALVLLICILSGCSQSFYGNKSSLTKDMQKISLDMAQEDVISILVSNFTPTYALRAADGTFTEILTYENESDKYHLTFVNGILSEWVRENELLPPAVLPNQ